MKHEPLSTSAAADTGGNGAHTDGGHSAESARAAVARDYHVLLGDVEALLSSAASMTAEEFALAKAKLSARVSAARASIGRAGGAVADRVRSGAKLTDQYVRDQPWQAVGIGAVVGLLIGVLLGRRGS